MSSCLLFCDTVYVSRQCWLVDACSSRVLLAMNFFWPEFPFRSAFYFLPFMATLKPKSNGPLYSNTVIGTLAVDEWTVTFGTASRGLCGLRSRPGLYISRLNNNVVKGYLVMLRCIVMKSTVTAVYSTTSLVVPVCPPIVWHCTMSLSWWWWWWWWWCCDRAAGCC